MQPLAIAALAVLTVLSVALWFLGARFSREKERSENRSAKADEVKIAFRENDI